MPHAFYQRVLIPRLAQWAVLKTRVANHYAPFASTDRLSSHKKPNVTFSKICGPPLDLNRPVQVRRVKLNVKRFRLFFYLERHMRHAESHRTQHIGLLRAAVLGANDGIVSTASLVLGVAAAGADSKAVLVAGSCFLRY